MHIAEESVEGRGREGEGMSKMMAQWLEKVKPGDKGLTRPPVSARVSEHKNEVRSITRGFFQIQFRVSVYKHVGKVTNFFMEQYTLPTDTPHTVTTTTHDDDDTVGSVLRLR